VPQPDRPVLGDVAVTYAEAGLGNIVREYPNHPSHVLTGPYDLVPPSRLHPIFYGSFDWHSSVHQHWMLVRLLRLFPDLEIAVDVRSTLDTHFTEPAARVEAAYFDDPIRRFFERPYGWAWLMTLAAELTTWDDPAAAVWEDALSPLTSTIRENCLDWLRGTPYPQRSGTHGNSAFAGVLLHDAASASGDDDLRDALEAAARRWYAGDGAYAAWLEPSASDFLSPGLVEADLMARILGDRLPAWIDGFLVDPEPLTVPAEVPDRTDPHGVHLDGLNLSRSWCWRNLADTLPADHRLVEVARSSARRHAAASLPSVLTGEYVGEHWLPTFAVYLLGSGAATPTEPR
jgi:hypothetical protein